MKREYVVREGIIAGKGRYMNICGQWETLRRAHRHGAHLWPSTLDSAINSARSRGAHVEELLVRIAELEAGK